MKRRVLSWILAGVLLCQSVNVEAAQFVDCAGPDQNIMSEETGSTDGEEELWMESLQDGEGLFQAGSFQIQERGGSEIALFSAAEDEQWEEWDAYICEHLKAKEASIDVKDFQIPSNQLASWYYAVINEHPELYFVNSEISWSQMGGVAVGFTPSYQEGYDDAAFARVAQEALSVVTEDMTDVQKAVALHDYLVVNCEYDYENYLNNTIPAESYTAYGALVKGTAVCQGYALAYKYLLQEVGIPCYMVNSSTMNHAWNMVELGGRRYQVDVTWDDPTWDSLGRVGHGNMFVSDKVLEERQKHSGWEIAYRGEKVEFQALDTTYDEFFWTDVTSPLILWGGSYYYIAKTKSINSIPVSASASGSLSCGDAVQVYENIGTWKVWNDPSYYWTEAYSGLFLLGERLYFNTPSQICSIKPDGEDMREELTADTANGYIYGCAYRRGEVCYVFRTTPIHSGKEEVLTAELSGEIGVDEVVLDNIELRLFNGAQARLTAEVSPKIATDKTILWSSSDEQIATVSSEGMVTAVGVGTCTITAAAGECSAVCAVTVVENDASLGKLEAPGFAPEGGIVEKGTEVVLTAADGAVIYYTTDGTVPDMGSKQYKQPIVITQDMTIKAYAVQEHYESSEVAEASYQLKEVKTYEVTFDLQGHGQQIAPVTVEEGNKLSKPNAPAEEGYLFEGWYQEAACATPWNFDTDVITSDTTLYAKWNMQGITINDITKDESYTERIDLNSVSGEIAGIKSKVYDGSPYTPTVKVTIQPETGKNKKLALTEGIDYRVHYENCTNAGTAMVVVEGNGNYTGTLRKEYTITQKAINKCKVVTGGLAVNDNPSKLSLHIYDGNKLLVKGKDYDFSADESLTAKKTNAAKVVVTGLGNYKGTLNAKFTVYEAGVIGVITPDSVNLSISSTPYTGKAIKVDDMLSVSVDGTVLEKNKQYSVAYKNNTNAGTAFVTITGKGGYAGKVVKSFTITPLSSQTLEIKDIPAKTYNGKVQTPAVTVKLGKKKLSKNKDYTLTYTNNLHAGKATVNITGKGNYAGTNGQVTFAIKAQKISKASVKGNREEGLTLTYSKKTLREGTDYSLSYDETSVNKNKIKVTIMGLGNFEGSEVTKTVKDAVRDPAAKITPKSSNNKGGQNYINMNRWTSTVKSYLTANQDGTLMRVEYTGSKVWAETYQADESCIDQREIKMELPVFGGFYAGKDNYFLVFGKKNPNEDDAAEVIRVVKYGKDWKRQGAASLYGANTTVPFDAGSLRMAEYGGMLYVRTCHKMYKSSDGLNHQANLTFCVKTDEMRITDQFSKVMNTSYGYVSHSFNQFIHVDGDRLVAVDHGDAYPRSVVLVQYLKEAGGENFTEGQLWWNEDGSYGMGNCINVEAFPIQGNAGANDTGVSVGGFEASSTAYLVAGNSVPQDDAASYDAFGKRNIFVTCTSKTAFAQTAAQTERESATTVRWITNYTEKDSVNVSTPQMVKLGDNEFLLLWTEGDTVKSVLLDGSGNPTTGIHSMKGALSDCQPILTGDSVTWYYTSNSKPVFCRLKISDVK